MDNSSKHTVLVAGPDTIIGRYVIAELKGEDVSKASFDRKHGWADIRNSELIVYCAADAEGDDAVDINYRGLLAFIEKLGSNIPKWFVFISSTDVYGRKDGELIDETTPKRTITKGAQGRALAEDALTEWAAKNGVLLTILRPALTIGEGCTERGMLKQMFSAVKSGTWFSVRDNDAQKSLVCALDVAKAARLLYKKGGIYNVCDGKNRPLSHLAAAMSENIGESKRPWVLPAKWTDLLLRIVRNERLRNDIDYRRTPLTFSNYRLIEATGMSLFDAVDVTARRCKEYPYEHPLD